MCQGNGYLEGVYIYQRRKERMNLSTRFLNCLIVQKGKRH